MRSVILTILLLAGTAAADPLAPEEIARAHAFEGAKHFSLGEFDAAASEYRAAYKAKADPAFLYDIAQCYRQAQDYSQALFFYRSYLHNLPDAPNRAEVERRIDELSKLAAASSNVAPTATTAQPGSSAHPRDSDTLAAKQSRDVGTARKPLHRRTWLWGVIGGVVVGGACAVGLGVGLTRSGGAPASHFGNATAF